MCIGRSPNCNIHIPHFTISRKHGKIKAVNETYMMYEDIGTGKLLCLTLNSKWVLGQWNKTGKTIFVRFNEK
jgi:pSer/pThr/pTyr-binding forkhead associated (FHA) protein